LTDIEVKSYQVTDEDWNNVAATVYFNQHIETCGFDAALLRGDMEITALNNEINVAGHVYLEDTQIATFSATQNTSAAQSEFELRGSAELNSNLYSGEYPFYVDLDSVNHITAGITLDDCFFYTSAQSNLGELIPAEAFTTEYSIDFTSLESLDLESLPIRQLKKPNEPLLVEGGIQLFPEGLELVDTYSTGAQIKLPAIPFSSNAGTAELNLDFTVAELDADICESIDLAIKPTIDGESVLSTFIIPNKGGRMRAGVEFLATVDHEAYGFNISAEGHKCIQGENWISPRIIVHKIVWQELEYNKHPLTGRWNLRLESAGDACDKTTEEGSIVIDQIPSSVDYALNDGSLLEVNVLETGEVKWRIGDEPWNNDQFMYAKSLWDTDYNDECTRSFSLARPIPSREK